jgi:hypothetical protein
MHNKSIKFSSCPTLMVPMHFGCQDYSCDNLPLNILQLISTATGRYTILWASVLLQLRSTRYCLEIETKVQPREGPIRGDSRNCGMTLLTFSSGMKCRKYSVGI